MARRILLTGGAGYIGSHTYVALTEAGYEVAILDNFSNAREDVPDRLARITGRPVTCHRCDVLDRESLGRILDSGRFDGVVHFAALKAVGESVLKPLEYFQANCGGLLNLLSAMRDAGVFRLVFSSTATVYGEPDTLPIPETAARRYNSPYACSKLMGEQMLEQISATDPRWTFGILRYFNPAGAHSSGLIGEDPNNAPDNLMPYIERVATGELPHLNVFGNDYDTPDGTGVRDYIHVEDLARGHVLSLDALLETGAGHVLNLGTGRGYSVLEMLRAYSKVCGREVPHVIVGRRPGDIAEYYADPSRAEQLLGFKAERGLEEMCASSWAWAQRSRADAGNG